MNAYLDPSFNSANYQSNRPSYPQSLFEALIAYHRGVKDTVVDVGCGTGIATLPFLGYFNKVIGCDPSAKMLHAAKESCNALTDRDRKRMEFKQVAAENLSLVLPRNSVDMVVGAESIHWVKHKPFFEEVYRILKPGGTLAYWFYVEPIFLDYPKANEVFQQYIYEDERYFAPYWPAEMKHVRNFGKSITIPMDKFEDFKSEIFVPLKTNGTTAFRMIRNNFTLQDFANLLRTWSIYHTWCENNRNNTVDIVDVIVEKLQLECGWDQDTKLRVEWGTCYYMARKRTL